MKILTITKYITGKSLGEQVKEYAESGKIDKETYLIFENTNILTTRDIYNMLDFFDIKTNKLIENNILFRPNDWLLSIIDNKAFHIITMYMK